MHRVISATPAPKPRTRASCSARAIALSCAMSAWIHAPHPSRDKRAEAAHTRQLQRKSHRAQLRDERVNTRTHPAPDNRAEAAHTLPAAAREPPRLAAQ